MTMKTIVALPGQGSAVGRVHRDGKTLTPDQCGRAKTREMARAVLTACRG